MAMIREFFQNLLYQVPSIGISDIVDILVVSIIFYSLLRLIRSTSAARVARAILLLLAITLLTDVLNLYTLNWLLNKILEVGVSSVSRQALMDALDDTFIFTDFMKEHGIPYTDRDGVYAVSSMQQLAEWKPVLSRGVLYDLAAAGVSIWDYDSTYVEPTVFVGAGAELLPGTVLRGTTSIADGCMIGPNSYLENVKVGENTRVNASQVYDSEIGADTTVGPFAYVRPGSRIGSHVRCGDFVEVKNSTIGDGTKISHLTYIGDSDVGKNINFGCGTVTVNYDRVKKSRTVIDDDAFIGCNANLIAPVHIGQGAYIAAGSTVTDDVPPAALAIARARQQNKRDWANRHKLKEKK